MENDFYSSLDALAQYCIDEIKEELDNYSVGYCLTYGIDYVSFGKPPYNDIVVLFNKNEQGVLLIHLYSLKLKKLVFAMFDKYKINDYINYIKRFLFEINESNYSFKSFTPKKKKQSKYKKLEIIETTPKPSSVKPPIKKVEQIQKPCIDSTFEEIQNYYHYAIRNNKIEHIFIKEITNVENIRRVYFVYESDETRKFCSLKNIDSILFNSIEEAKKHLQSIALKDIEHIIGDYSISNENISYVIKDFSNTYFSGYHESKQFETESYGHRKAESSYAVINVPNFTPNILKAERFFSKESAEQFAKKLEPATGKLYVVRFRPPISKRHKPKH